VSDNMLPGSLQMPVPRKTCQWSDEEDAYWTSCGHGFNCMEDGVKENGFRFCPYCGGMIILTAEAGGGDDD
jgi:hypothetical protein